MLAAFVKPGVIQQSGPALGIALSDLLIHGWDLAKATGQDTTMPAGLADRGLRDHSWPFHRRAAPTPVQARTPGCGGCCPAGTAPGLHRAGPELIIRSLGSASPRPADRWGERRGPVATTPHGSEKAPLWSCDAMAAHSCMPSTSKLNSLVSMDPRPVFRETVVKSALCWVSGAIPGTRRYRAAATVAARVPGGMDPRQCSCHPAGAGQLTTNTVASYGVVRRDG